MGRQHIPAIVFVGLLLPATAWAYAGTWHVVENLATQTCYRVHSMETRAGWRDYGAFNTFRMAGAWIWRHRDLCRKSPVFD